MIIIHSDWVLGKASLTETKCWVIGPGLGEVSPVVLKPQRVCSARRRPLCLQCCDGRGVQEMVGEEAGPGCSEPCRHSEDSGCSSRAVRSQGRLFSRKVSD